MARPGRVFGPRDFNTQVMMNIYAPEERAALAPVLRQLVDEAILRHVSPTEYEVTPAGLQRLKSLRRAPAVH